MYDKWPQIADYNLFIAATQYCSTCKPCRDIVRIYIFCSNICWGQFAKTARELSPSDTLTSLNRSNPAYNKKWAPFIDWLWVPEYITFRLAVLAYRRQHNMAPHYLTAQIHRASNGYRQRLRSSSLATLDVPLTKHVTIGGHAFSSTAARVWNSLQQCSLLSRWTFFNAAWKLNCSSVLTTETTPVKRLYCCVTHFHFPAAFCCGRNLDVYWL